MLIVIFLHGDRSCSDIIQTLHAGAVHDSSAYDTAPTGNVTGLDTGYGNNNVAMPASRGYVGNTPTGGTPVLHTDRV